MFKVFFVAFVAMFVYAQAENCDEIFCTYEYAPVCAQPKEGGKAETFGNKCAVKAFACRQNKGKLLNI